jgi:hypothetical protein
MPAGRPFGTLKYDNVEDLEKGINDYFADCEKRKKPYTMSGLAYALNVDRRTLLNYSHKDNYFPAISRARARVEQDEEEGLNDKNRSNGMKFALSNNHPAWSDKMTLDQTISSGGNGFAININVVDKVQDKPQEDS